MAFFAFGAATRERFARHCRLLSRRLALLIEGMHPRSGNARQCKVAIGFYRALERFRGARPGREHEIDALAIGVRGVGGVCREGKAVTILVCRDAHGFSLLASSVPRSDRPGR